MEISVNVFDVWVFRRTEAGIRFLLLYTSQVKADRYFNGGRFWQIPSDFIGDQEDIVDAIDRRLAEFGLEPISVWAAEHAYTIYNRRFNTMQIIGVYAAETGSETVKLDPEEHSQAGWYSSDECLERIHFRGLKEGLRSVCEYVTGPVKPAAELQLR